MNRSNHIIKTEREIDLKKEVTMKTGRNIKKRMSGTSLFAAAAAGLFIIAVVLVTQPFSAEARGRFGSWKSPEQIVERLTDRLDLTEEQVGAVRPIIENKVRAMNEIRERSGKDRQAARAEMQKLRRDTETKLNEILDDGQAAKYLELRRERRGRFFRDTFSGKRTDRGFNRTPEEITARLAERLDLTGKQAVEIAPVIRESLEKKKAVFDRYGEKRREVRQAMRDEMQAIRDDTHKQLSNILTAEQIENLQTFMEERPSRNKFMGRHGAWR